MNNQFATQFLREDMEEVSVEELMASLKPILDKAQEAGQLDAFLQALEKTLNTPTEEASMTGGAPAASQTAASFKPGVGMEYTTKQELEEDAPILAGGKIKNNYAVSHFGYKLAPSIPNRKSDAIQYKKIFEADFEEAALTPEENEKAQKLLDYLETRYCLLYTSPSPRDRQKSRMPSSA